MSVQYQLSRKMAAPRERTSRARWIYTLQRDTEVESEIRLHVVMRLVAAGRRNHVAIHRLQTGEICGVGIGWRSTGLRQQSALGKTDLSAQSRPINTIGRM